MAGESFGEFALLRKLATGGMAEVFLARRRSVLPGFAKLVAIKRMLPHLAEDPEFITMFLDEARTASHLNHPNVVQIFDVGEAGGMLYLAMEFLDGISVMALLQRNIELRAMDPLFAAAIGVQVCQGLDYAHELTLSGEPMGLVHRDISPQNLMLTFGGVVKVLDFGIAKAAGSASVTRAGALKGKLRYIAPEQYEFRPVDRRTDIYALGVVLFELATATRAFSGEDWEIVQQVQKGQLPPAHQLRAEVPAPLSAVIARAMAVNPDDRYQTSAALGDALLDVMRQLGHVLTAADLALMAQTRFGHDRLDLSPYGSGEHRPVPPPHAAWPSAGRHSEEKTLLPTPAGPPEEALKLPVVYEGSLEVLDAPQPRRIWLYPALTSVALASMLTIGGLRLSHHFGRVAEPAPISTPARPLPTPPIPAVLSEPERIDREARSAAVIDREARSAAVIDPPESIAPAAMAMPLPQMPTQPLLIGPPKADGTPPTAPVVQPTPHRKPSSVSRVSYGFLVIDSKPSWAKVYAYGRLIGQTPIVNRYLPVGWTHLKVVNGKTQAQRMVRVHIKKGEVTTTLVRWQ